MATTVKIGQRFPLTIKRLDINGAGIGYYQRKITFVIGALPGEVVVAEVTAIHDRYLEAKTHKIRSASLIGSPQRNRFLGKSAALS